MASLATRGSRVAFDPSLRERFTAPNGAPRARFLLLVGSLSIFGPLCIDMYLPALPRIAIDLGSGASAVQLSLTTCLVGLGLGQLLIGPIADRFGRRSPLRFGISLFVLASLSCSLAHSAALLAVCRFGQGLGGASGIVVSRAVVRDIFEGESAARVFSMLMLVTGLGPILAPQIGAALLAAVSWRGVFLALAAIGTVLLLVSTTLLPETLAEENRSHNGFAGTVSSMRRVARSRNFLRSALACSLSFGAIFAYVSGASFVLEDIYGLSPQKFGLVFAANAVGLVAASQVNARIVSRFGAARLMTIGLFSLSASAIAFFLVVVVGHGGLAAVLPCLFGVLASNGFIGPNAIALALQDFPDAAGTASALLGLSQFALGAAVAPIVGLAGNHDALPMAVLMAALGLSGLTVRLLLTRRASERHDQIETSRIIAVNENSAA